MAAEGRKSRATGLGGYSNQPLVRTEAAALTRVSRSPAFLFSVTRGGRQGGMYSSFRQARSQERLPVGRVNANLPVTTHEVSWNKDRRQMKMMKSVFQTVREGEAGERRNWHYM